MSNSYPIHQTLFYMDDFIDKSEIIILKFKN